MVLKLGKAKKKPKKEFPAPIDGMRRQVGALPWRLGPAGLEIMLVSSRATRRWIVPKGWPMAGRADHVAAGIEAIEEAGLLGVSGQNSDNWRSKPSGRRNKSTRSRVGFTKPSRSLACSNRRPSIQA